MTFQSAKEKWDDIVGDNKPFKDSQIETMQYFFFKMGENAGVKKVGRALGLGINSWDTNPDRSGGQFTEEEKNRSTWK